jgi:Domain of unknown function (DUF5753)
MAAIASCVGCVRMMAFLCMMAWFRASDNAAGTVYMESPDQGQTTEVPSVVRRLSRTFDTLRADALPRGASRDLIGKVAEE